MANDKFSNLDMPTPAQTELVAKNLVAQHALRTNQPNYLWASLNGSELNYWKAAAVQQITFANWRTYYGN